MADDLQAARDLLVAKLALEQELVTPLTVAGFDYIQAREKIGGRDLSAFERMDHVARFEQILLRHYCRTSMVVTGRRPPRDPSVNEAAISMRHMASMVNRAKDQAQRIVNAIDREMRIELERAGAASAIADDGTGHPVAGKAALDDIETKAEKVTGVTAGMVGRYRARIPAMANVNTNVVAEEARHESIIDRMLDTGGQLKQEWNSLMDGRERPAHHEAHGQIRNIDEPFEVGGALLRFPGDSGLGAPLSMTINCRCFLYTFIEREDGSREGVHVGTSAPARRQRRRGDRVGRGERMPAQPTSLVTLNGNTRATIVLRNGDLATLRQQTPTTIVVRQGRTTIARATTQGGTVTNITVDPAYASSGIEDLIRRSVAHSAAR